MKPGFYWPELWVRHRLSNLAAGHQLHADYWSGLRSLNCLAGAAMTARQVTEFATQPHNGAGYAAG